MKNRATIGSFVGYNGMVGVILLMKPYKTDFPKRYETWFCLTLILKDKNGKKPRKRILKSININSLKEIDKFDIEHINKDWFKNLPKF